MISLKSSADIEAMGRAAAILAGVFEQLRERVEPGVNTADLDAFVEDAIRSHTGAEPAFKGLYGFPASACVSINEEVVHGIPSPDRSLEEGDIVSIDIGVELDGWFADSARTFPVGAVGDETRRLLDTTREALDRGIREARPGNRLGDIGHAIQTTAENAGFSIVRELVGHGIGRSPHEDPQVPNFGPPSRGLRLQPGLVLAIEPMLNVGSAEIRTLADRWTVVTTDGRRSAHFEHTVAITESGPRVLTAPTASTEDLDFRAVG